MEPNAKLEVHVEHKRAEEMMRESDKRYHALLDSVPMGLYRTTPKGQMVDANVAL